MEKALNEFQKGILEELKKMNELMEAGHFAEAHTSLKNLMSDIELDTDISNS